MNRRLECRRAAVGTASTLAGAWVMRAPARRIRKLGAVFLLGTSAATLLATAALAVAPDTTFTGNGASSNWSDAANWDNGTPTAGQNVALTQAGTHPPSVFDINLTAASLTLNTATDATTLANGYLVNNDGSHTFTLQSGGLIEDAAVNGAADQLNMGITLSGPATIQLDTGATGLVIGGAGISGSGPLTVTDNSAVGNIVFTGNNTYTGGTTITAGTLQLGNGGTTGAITGDVVDNGNLTFDRSDAVAFSGTITGTGSVTQAGSGVLTLSGTSLYSGGTTISAGTLSVSADANLGAQAGTVAIAGGATLELTQGFANTRNVTLSGGTATIQTDGSVNAVSTFGGLISGAGGLVKTGGGVLAVTANDTYLGGTTVSAGILSLGAVQSGSTAGMVTGDITDNGTVAFNRTDNLTYANVISGSGGVNKNFGNTLIFTGNNSYTGTTTVAAGTLQLGNGGTTGIVAGAVALGGTIDPITHLVTSFATLDFNRSDNLTFAGAITGLGALVKDNTNTVILTGANFYQSGTTINAGTLQVGDGGTAGSIAGNIAIANGASFVANLASPATLTIAGVISGGGSLSQIGTGTTVLSGANTYTGGTTISAGTLQIGNGGSGGAIVGDVLDNGALVINLNNQITVLPGPVIVTTPTFLTLAGNITGTGTLSQIGTGTTILTGTNTYSGGTAVSVGTLQIGNGGTAGSITGDVTDNATLAFDRSDAIGFGGNITGAGGVAQIGGGTLTLSGTNTYAGGTAVSNGVLSVASHSNIGSGAVTISNGATLLLSAADAFTNGAVLGTGGGTIQTNGSTDVWSGAISGTGGLTKTGSGILALTGSNTFSGGTTISGGTLQIGNGGVNGAIMGPVTDNATLAFDRSDNPTFSDVISGSGGVEQDGGGTLTLAGTNTYTGNTYINAGTIAISADANLGSGGTVVMAAGTTLKTTATGTYTHDVQVSGDPTFNVASGTTTTWSGLISDGATPPGTVEVTGGGTFKPTNAGNSYTGGTVVKNGSTITITLDHDLGDPAGNLTLGDATTPGTLEVAANLVSGRAMVLAAGGSTVLTDSGVTFETIQPITGAGKLTVAGPGTFVIAGASTYSGGTAVNAGASLQLGDGAAFGTVAGNILDNGAFTLNEAADVTLAGVISGSGALTQNDVTGHTVTLTGANTFTGVTTITAGTLQIGNGGTTGSLAGPVVDNDTLAFNRSDAVTIPGAITGTGQLVQAGTGTLILTGNSTYAGSTTVNAGGTLQLGNGGTSGSVAGSGIVDNGTLAFNRSDTFVVGVLISGSGNVQQNGTGTTVLTQDETYSGTTTINAGTLQIGNGGTTGAIQSNITDNGALAFNRSDTAIYAFVASGTGSLKQAGTGTLTLTGNNTYSGGTTISAGTLQVGAGGTTGALGTGNVTDNGALVFNRSDTVQVDGAISGTGTLRQAGAGTLILTGANTLTGGTDIASGTLQIGNGGANGSLAGDIADSSHLVFNRSGTLVFGGVISGTGTAAQIGPGVTALTGTNTYSGGTTITAGTLQLGNGGTTGTIAGNVADGGILAFNRSNALSFGGVISGAGGVSQIGSGTTTLTGASTYTGATTVNGGTLLVTGSIGSSATTVNAGGTLGGTGTVGALTVAGGGVLAPGTGGIGTLNVHGNAALASNSTFTVDSTAGATDLLSVSGSAALNGTITLNPSGSGYALGQSITVVNAAGGVSGTFSSVVVANSFGASLFPVIGYDANHAFITFQAAAVTPLLPAGASGNTQSVAGAIDFAIAHDSAAVAFAPLGGLSGAQLEHVLSQMTGEEATAFQTAMGSSMAGFLGTLLDPSIGGRSGLADGGNYFATAANAPYAKLADNSPDAPIVRSRKPSLTLWASFRGLHNRTDADPALGTHQTNASDLGGAVGFDYSPASFGGAVGLAAGLDSVDWDLASDTGKGHAMSRSIGAYYSRKFGPNYFSAAFSYAFYEVKTDRTVVLGGTNTYEARFNARNIAGRFEFGRAFRAGEDLITPYALFQVQDLGTPDYFETTIAGSPAFALSYTRKQHFDYLSELGAGWNTIIDRNVDALTDLHARLAWMHDYATSIDNTATFSSFSGASFTVRGAPPPRDAAHVKLGVEHDFDQLAFTVNAEGILSGTTQNYGGTAGLSYRW